MKFQYNKLLEKIILTVSEWPVFLTTGTCTSWGSGTQVQWIQAESAEKKLHV